MARSNLGRRRRRDKPAISAMLILDGHMAADVGRISADVAADLYPNSARDDTQPDPMCYIAMSPWIPNATANETDWTIVPAIIDATLPHSTLRFSPSSPALQSFAMLLQQLAPSKLSSPSRSGIELLLLDVVPLPLETIFVSIDSESTKKLQNGHATLGHSKSSALKANGSASTSPQHGLETAIRSSLSTLKVVHHGDSFLLPLASDPANHMPPKSGRIMLCEPVAQGVLTDDTNIVLMRGRARTRQSQDQKLITATHSLLEEDESHTDQFYSAVEEGHRTDWPTDAPGTTTATETEVSDPEQQHHELSDDSMDEMISLQTPTLPPTTASAIGTMQPATPMTMGTLRGRKTNGIATPGSVLSTLTTATNRPDRTRPRLFRAQGLLRPMPSDLLHPKPSPEDDDEARIYVDMSSLPKIGCFSGDWVHIEAAEDPPLSGFGALNLGSLHQMESEASNWRPVRVYSLPDGYSQRPMTRISSSKVESRSLSFFDSQTQRLTSPTAYASPILLANLDNATYLRISAPKKTSHFGKQTQTRFGGASNPPYAKDIAIHSIRTPISTERAYQTAVLGGLKRYFSRKIRLVRTGDLIAVPVDSRLGRVLQEAPGVTGTEVDDVVALTNSNVDNVAWFRVRDIQIQQSDEDEQSNEALWGSVACIDSSTVGMHGTGSETSRIPGTSHSSWPYYLGVKNIPHRLPRVNLPSLAEMAPSYTSPLRQQLKDLFSAATSSRALHLKMPPMAILLTSSHRNVGKTTLVQMASADVGLHTYSMDAYNLLAEGGSGGGDVKTEGFLRSRSERAMSCGPDCCVLLIEHIEALTADRIESTIKEILDKTRVLVATSNQVDQIPDGVRGIFSHEFDIGAPDEAERDAILRTVIDNRGLSLDPAIDTSSIALKTAALVAGDLVDVVKRALTAKETRLEELSLKHTHEELAITVRDVQVSGGLEARCLTAADFDAAVDAARKNFSDSIGAPKIPNVTWDDVGGLSNVKNAVAETIQLPLERPELFAKGMKKRSGILFYGPPGTGKTLLAKAIATEYSLNFFSVKGPELLNMYIGESEANVRRVFQRARDARPCVVFFDELDSVAPKRGNQGDSGGVMDRIVSQLLAELDGMSGGDDAGGVFVVGATNRPDLLDPALLRPGRFDKMLYLGVSDTHEKQLTILEALTRKFTLDPSCSLRAVAEHLPFTYTGADLYALCSDAMLKAVTRQAAVVDSHVQALNAQRGADVPPITTAYWFDHYASSADVGVVVTETDFTAARNELVPSVSAGELAHYDKVRATFEGVGMANGNARQEAKPSEEMMEKRVQVEAEHQVDVKEEDEAERNGRVAKSRRNKKKGKGKAVATSYDEDDDHAMNGSVDKGKGKANVGFQQGTVSDDDGLY